MSKFDNITARALRDVRRLATRKSTKASIAKYLGVSLRTFMTWMSDDQKNPKCRALRHYYDQGKELSKEPLGETLLYLRERHEQLMDQRPYEVRIFEGREMHYYVSSDYNELDTEIKEVRKEFDLVLKINHEQKAWFTTTWSGLGDRKKKKYKEAKEREQVKMQLKEDSPTINLFDEKVS